MASPIPSAPPQYLVVGHLSLDHTRAGRRLGGTAAYAALTARALGRRPAILTAARSDLDLTPLSGVEVVSLASPVTTGFQASHGEDARRLRLLDRADSIDPTGLPDAWKRAPLIHLGPIAGEISPSLLDLFAQGSLIGITAQGWMRSFNSLGAVSFGAWTHASAALRRADVVVVSLEDLAREEERAESLAAECRLLVVTEGARGARVYWNRDVRRVPAPPALSLDPTGAGDIFAAAFLVRYQHTRDPWESARFANHLAACSVTRSGLDSVPTAEEVGQAEMVVVP